jgi:putative oligomerization/nucleic acid binding protein
MTTAPPDTVEARLADLDDLRAAGVITDDEYATKRAAILAEM